MGLLAAQGAIDDAPLAGDGAELQHRVHLPQRLRQVLLRDLLRARHIGVVAGVDVALLGDQGELGGPIAAVGIHRQVGHLLAVQGQLRQGLLPQGAGGAGGEALAAAGAGVGESALHGVGGEISIGDDGDKALVDAVLLSDDRAVERHLTDARSNGLQGVAGGVVELTAGAAHGGACAGEVVGVHRLVAQGVQAAADAYGEAARLYEEAGDTQNPALIEALFARAYALTQLKQWTAAAIVWDSLKNRLPDDHERVEEIDVQLRSCTSKGAVLPSQVEHGEDESEEP